MLPASIELPYLSTRSLSVVSLSTTSEMENSTVALDGLHRPIKVKTVS